MYLLKARYILWPVIFWQLVARFWRRFKQRPKMANASTQTTSKYNCMVDDSTQTEQCLNNLIIVEYCPRV